MLSTHRKSTALTKATNHTRGRAAMLPRAAAQRLPTPNAERCQEKNSQRLGIARLTKVLAPELAMDSDTVV